MSYGAVSNPNEEPTPKTAQSYYNFLKCTNLSAPKMIFNHK